MYNCFSRFNYISEFHDVREKSTVHAVENATGEATVERGLGGESRREERIVLCIMAPFGVCAFRCARGRPARGGIDITLLLVSPDRRCKSTL